MHRKNKFHLGNQSGFTLIELLVVISIIGILSTITITTLNGAKAKARDSRRYVEMNEIKKALELYYADHGSYPNTNGYLVCLGLTSSQTCWGGASGSDALNAALAPYMPTIPVDPVSNRLYNAYVYRFPGQYWLPAPVNTVSGSYSLAFMPDQMSGNPACGKWTLGAWDQSPGGVHCPAGGSCRQCGYLAP